MPIYRYSCSKCNSNKEEFRHISNRDNAPHCCNSAMQRVLVAPMVQGDIQPYRAIAIDKETGKIPHIGSRKQHREFLLRNDYVEVGSQPFKPTQRSDDAGSNVIFDTSDL